MIRSMMSMSVLRDWPYARYWPQYFSLLRFFTGPTGIMKHCFRLGGLRNVIRTTESPPGLAEDISRLKVLEAGRCAARLLRHVSKSGSATHLLLRAPQFKQI